VAVAEDRSVFATLEGEKPLLAHFTAGGAVDRLYPLTGVSGLTGVVLARDDRAYVLSTSPAEVSAVDLRTGDVTVVATIPDVAPCLPVVRTNECDASVIDRAPAPWAAAFNSKGQLFVSDSGQGVLWVVPPAGGRAAAWLVDPAFARVDRPSGPTGLAFDGAGNLVFAVPATSTADAGAVYLQEVAADGTPGTRRTLATFAAGDHPAGVAISQAGNGYVTLPETGAVVVMGTDGRELRRIVVAADLRAGAVTGLAFDGASLIAAGRPSSTSSDTALVKLDAGESGGTLHRAS
jgi:sugar lactone lactonase YvrE